MKKSILLTNLVSALLVLVAVQVHGFEPFDFESEFPQDFEASKFTSEPQYFPETNPEEPSLLSQFENPQDFQETHSSKSERPYDPLEIPSFPEKTSRLSDNEFPKEFEYPVESFEYGTDALREIKSSPPSPSPPPSESQSPSPSPSVPEDTCVHKCGQKCLKVFFPPLRKICLKFCKKICSLNHSVLVYKCTSRCAETMPRIFRSDLKKSAGYVEYCNNNCIAKL
ncbi:hypothetical protein F3Y22_tig00000778pilonHSYRG00245 [Hibiscus syriacus]|uniref:Uncharacterized protein n=1 Tax=Hibiscus syriacus TaxID=106335 RepID=A0A6A3CX47_HIBSY|nr:hypothetical protein F3Y22_tig00000778pilonHSYRG00245 [Hibiscus syriacus]